jgi:hypothetical protein
MKGQTRPLSVRTEAIVLSAAVVLSIVLHAAFIIHGFGEPDIARLVVAAAEWHETGRTVYFSYIYRTSPLYIHALKFLLDLGFPLVMLPVLLNWASVVLGGLTLIPLYLYWRKLANRGAAAIGCVLLVFAPAFWLANIYGMAHLPSFSLFVVSLLLFALALKREGRPRSYLVIGSAVLAIGAVTLKADMILCYGAFLGTAVCLRAVNWRTVLLSLGIPAFAAFEVTMYAKAIAPSLSGVTEFAGDWSATFPFTIEALTDPYNRSVLVNSLGRLFFALVVMSVAYCLILRRHRSQLILIALWALPPILFWGLKLGNSARHMMAAVSALVFLIAIVFTTLVRSLWLRGALVVLALTVNYMLGPPEGDSISPAPRLTELKQGIQGHVTKLQEGAVTFALFPVPAKRFVGGPGTPYSVFEVMSRAVELETYEGGTAGDGPLELAEVWPRYVATYEDGSVHTVSFQHATAPVRITYVENWFLFTFEPDIVTTNDMRVWRPFIQDAVRSDPQSVYGWAERATLKIEAGLALAEIEHYDEALTMFREALKVRPNSADALWNTAILMAHFDRPADARRLLSKFLQFHPNDPRAELGRAQLRAMDAEGR